jgi:hypothetical protein
MHLVKMAKMVLWNFFGIRKTSAHEEDVATTDFQNLRVVAILIAAVMAMAIIWLIHLVSNGTSMQMQGL